MEIQIFINCNTRNIVYLITCKACAVQYVGRTTRRLRDGLHDHVYDTEKEHNTNVARHFNGTHGGDTSLIQIQGIERVAILRGSGDRFRLLCKCEVFWIFFFADLNSDGPQF